MKQTINRISNRVGDWFATLFALTALLLVPHAIIRPIIGMRPPPLDPHPMARPARHAHHPHPMRRARRLHHRGPHRARNRRKHTERSHHGRP